MASTVEWDDIAPPKPRNSGGGGGTGGGSGKYGKFEANKEYLLRPVLKPVKFYKYYHKLDGALRTAITDDADTCVVLQKHKSSGLRKAQERRGFLAFDRNDNNKLKIWEVPPSAIEAFKHFKKLTKDPANPNGKEPGGPHGGDFLFKIVCPSGQKDRDTTYVVEFAEAKPFTEEEKAFVKANKEEFNLEKIFASNTPEEIETRLLGPAPTKENNYNRPRNDGGSSSASKPAVVAPPKVAEKPVETVAAQSSDQDDPFKW